MRKTTLPGTALALAVGVLAGCGGGGNQPGGDHPHGAPSASGHAPTGAQVSAAMKQATSVHVSGAVQSKGQTTDVNVSLTKAGQMSGTLSVGDAPVQILVTGGQAYLKMDAKFLRAQNIPTSTCAIVCGHWVKAPASTVGDFNQEAWGKLVTPIGAATGKINTSSATAVTFDGQPAWLFTGPHAASAYVARSGKPYLLGLKQGTENLTFSQWDSATIPGPPPAGSVVSVP